MNDLIKCYSTSTVIEGGMQLKLESVIIQFKDKYQISNILTLDESIYIDSMQIDCWDNDTYTSDFLSDVISANVREQFKNEVSWWEAAINSREEIKELYYGHHEILDLIKRGLNTKYGI